MHILILSSHRRTFSAFFFRPAETDSHFPRTANIHANSYRDIVFDFFSVLFTNSLGNVHERVLVIVQKATN